MIDLAEKWQVLSKKYFLDNADAQEVWTVLQYHYSQSDRHYHGLTHLKALFITSSTLQLKWEQEDIVHFAIWFHDVIYDATRTDNEQKSTELALDYLQKKTSLSTTQLQTIEFLILATVSHSLLIDTLDCRQFLDLDLSILGASWPSYQQYAAQIRQEYQHVPSQLYQQGRSQVLEKFLERETIFYSKIFQERYEKQARENMQREIQLLKSSL